MLSVVIPVFNAASFVGETISAILRILPAHATSFEVVIVDDGSSDDTPAIVCKSAALDPRVRTILLPLNEGKGSAVRAGVLAARGEQILFTDADLPYDLSIVPEFVQKLTQGCDVVLGSRHTTEAHTAQAGIQRTFLSTLFLWLANHVLLRPVSDTQCGIKGFRKEAAHSLFTPLQTRRFCFDVEVILRAQEQGLRVCEVPVVLMHSDSSSVRVARDGLEMLRALMRIYIVQRLLRRKP